MYDPVCKCCTAADPVSFVVRWLKVVFHNDASKHKCAYSVGTRHVWQLRTFLPSASWLSLLGLRRHPKHTLPSSLPVSVGPSRRWRAPQMLQLCHKAERTRGRRSEECFFFSGDSKKILNLKTNPELKFCTRPGPPSSPIFLSPPALPLAFSRSSGMLIWMRDWYVYACVTDPCQFSVYSTYNRWKSAGAECFMRAGHTSIHKPPLTKPVSHDQSGSKVTASLYLRMLAPAPVVLYMQHGPEDKLPELIFFSLLCEHILCLTCVSHVWQTAHTEPTRQFKAFDVKVCHL